MMNAQDVVPGGALKCFVVGNAGTGKSSFAATVPTPACLFDFDKGILSYRGKDFDYFQYELKGSSWSTFDKDLTQVLQSGKYKTIVIDSTTSMSDVAMEFALDVNPSPDRIPQWNVHYSVVKSLVMGRMRKLLSFPGNIVVLGHLQTTKDETTGAILVTPLLIGQLVTQLPGYFDEVYYATTRKKGDSTEWVLQTVAKGYYNARSRLSGTQALLPTFVQNDYAAIMAHVDKQTTKG